MKKYVFILLVTLVIFNCKISVSKQPNQISWGPESNGLRCGLSYESTTVSTGIPVRLKVIVENLSDKPMKIPEPNDDTVQLFAGPIGLTCNRAKLDKTITIKPKEYTSTTLMFDFGKCLFDKYTNRTVRVFSTYRSRFGPRIQLKTGEVIVKIRD